MIRVWYWYQYLVLFMVPAGGTIPVWYYYCSLVVPLVLPSSRYGTIIPGTSTCWYTILLVAAAGYYGMDGMVPYQQYQQYLLVW